jgi:hypothetical protein
MRRLLLLASVVTIGLALVAGCSTSSKKNDSGAAPPAAGPGFGAASGGGASAASSAGGATSHKGSAATAPELPDRALVKTAALSVRVADVNAQAGRAVRIATAAGGDVLADERDGAGAQATADLTLEVPPDTLETDLDRLAALGDQLDRTTNTDDVTQQVVDVASRLTSLRDSLNRVRTLYGRADTIADVIRLESELTSRQAELEKLETQQHDLARQTARATIKVHLQARPAVRTVPPPKHHGGVGRGFSGGWHAFVTFVRWTVTGFGAVLPFLVVVLAGAGGALWWRRSHSHRPATEPSAPSEPPRS